MENIYKFDFWKFRNAVKADRTYRELEIILERSCTTIRHKIVLQSKITMEEFMDWCNRLDLDPFDYIDVGGQRNP